MVGDFFPYSQEQLGFDKPATIVFQSDEGNSSKMLGKTAHYDPRAFDVVLYVDGRHPKDIMRSLNHELVHHSQNCAGKFENLGPTEEGYAQSDPYLRKMEKQAYEDMTFRDWENQRNQIRENKKMKTITNLKNAHLSPKPTKITTTKNQ